MTGLVSPVDTRRKNVDVSQDALGTDHLDAVVMPIGIIDPVSINDARNEISGQTAGLQLLAVV